MLWIAGQMLQKTLAAFHLLIQHPVLTMRKTQEFLELSGNDLEVGRRKVGEEHSPLDQCWRYSLTTNCPKKSPCASWPPAPQSPIPTGVWPALGGRLSQALKKEGQVSWNGC